MKRGPKPKRKYTRQQNLAQEALEKILKRLTDLDERVKIIEQDGAVHPNGHVSTAVSRLVKIAKLDLIAVLHEEQAK